MAPRREWLAIDVGNTRIKWGVGDVGRWRITGTLPTAEARSLAQSLPVLDRGTCVVACCVAGRDAEAAVASACAKRTLPAQWVRAAAGALGVTNGYAEPAQLGADRWAALVAAHARTPADQLVVAAGTALTVDALRADGRFLGGIIVPGVALMARALTQGTARLRPATGRVTPFPDCTDDAIATGAVLAACGAVDRMQHALRSAGRAPKTIVLTGGAAHELAPHLEPAPTVLDHLVLDGLAALAPTLTWPA